MFKAANTLGLVRWLRVVPPAVVVHLFPPQLPDDRVHDVDGLHWVVGHRHLVESCFELTGKLAPLGNAHLMRKINSPDILGPENLAFPHSIRS